MQELHLSQEIFDDSNPEWIPLPVHILGLIIEKISTNILERTVFGF